MITYSYLQTYIVIHLLIVVALLMIGKGWKKSMFVMEILAMICWAVFSWHYQLDISKHLPSGLFKDHYFMSLFVTVVYGFGCWLSLILTFTFGVIGVSNLMTSDGSSSKKAVLNGQHHTPLPLWAAGLAVGVLSAFALQSSLIPQMNHLMDSITNAIYVKLFHMNKAFPTCYIPVAGIAAGSFIAACFSGLYHKSKAPFVYFLSLVLVPVLTAILAPLVDFAGSILVLVFIAAGFMMRGAVMYASKKRNPLPYILLAFAIGCLSGLYMKANHVVVLGTKQDLNLVGGIASGVMIAILGYRSYRYNSNIGLSLSLLGFIPFITPGCSSAIAFILSLIGAAFFLIFCRPTVIISGNEEMHLPNGDPVKPLGGGRYDVGINGQTVTIEATSEMDTFVDGNGRKYIKNGVFLDPQS
ncbi:MAG: hypothetical protein K6A77_01710 [Clostridiales bacterium]|nr:hypothetical protein [Clostridiales bacterium]